MTQPEKSASGAIQKALQQDRTALEELLLLRYDWLRDIAHKAIPISLREKVCVEDVLQESLVRILRGFASFSPKGEASLLYWLKTVVQNTAKDALRSNLRTRVALANLDPKYQQVIQKIYIDQISIEQVAVNLETTEAALRSLRQRAREKIREAMIRSSHFV